MDQLLTLKFVKQRKYKNMQYSPLPRKKDTLNKYSFGPPAGDISRHWYRPSKEAVDLDKFRKDSQEELQQQKNQRDLNESRLEGARANEEYYKQVDQLNRGGGAPTKEDRELRESIYQDAYKKYLSGQMSAEDFNEFRKNKNRQPPNEYELGNMKRQKAMDDYMNSGFAAERGTQTSGPDPRNFVRTGAYISGPR